MIWATIFGIASTAIHFATPYLYASVGEAIGQLSGVLNLGVDGIMLMGAYIAFFTALQTESLILGLLAAAGVGGEIPGDREPAWQRPHPHRDPSEPQGDQRRLPARGVQQPKRTGAAAEMARKRNGDQPTFSDGQRRRHRRLGDDGAVCLG